MENLRIWEICNPSPIQSSFPVKLCCYTFRWDGLKEERRRGGNRQTVQNMLDAIFGVQLSGHLRFSHEWRCVRCYSEDHYTRHTPPLQMLWSTLLLLTQDWPGQLSFVDFPRIVWRWCLLLAGRSLTKIESVACQIWTSLGQLTIFPATHLLSWSEGGHQDLLRAWPATSQAARPVNGTFPSFYGRSIPRSWSK